MVATSVCVAAIENVALEPNRKTQIVNRVASLTTREEAAAFLREVKAKIKARRR
jgi:hypothetical protein